MLLWPAPAAATGEQQCATALGATITFVRSAVYEKIHLSSYARAELHLLHVLHAPEGITNSNAYWSLSTLLYVEEYLNLVEKPMYEKPPEWQQTFINETESFFARYNVSQRELIVKYTEEMLRLYNCEPMLPAASVYHTLHKCIACPKLRLVLTPMHRVSRRTTFCTEATATPSTPYSAPTDDIVVFT